jgi:hypothetical protein
MKNLERHITLTLARLIRKRRLNWLQQRFYALKRQKAMNRKIYIVNNSHSDI